MIFIRKQRQIPQAFLDAVAGLTLYDELQGDKRDAVIKLLFEEQGGLCAICERKRIRFSPTLEHFFAQSIFPHLQLDYYNLYGTCQQCNGAKAHHLIPAYIFDPRFDPFPNEFKHITDVKPVFHFIDSTKCTILVPDAIKSPKKNIQPIHHSAYIMQSSLDLMQQNRYGEHENLHGSDNSLLLNRATVFEMYLNKLGELTNERLLSKYRNMIQQNTYPEFVSLVVYMYSKEFKRRNMTVSM